MKKIPIAVIAGTTASGKTGLSIKLAKEIDGEIISADSMQIYKYMDIGTAKPTHDEQEGVVHHMIDIVDPSESFSVAQYTKMAHDVIFDVYKRGKMPILVGGTGLYINSLINDIPFDDIDVDEEYRRELMEISKQKGEEYIWKMLNDIDPKTAQMYHANNIKRIIRAIEFYHTTGKTFSKHQEETKNIESRYNPVMMEIFWDRQKLYERINKRVDIMIESGLVDEVKVLLDMGYTRELQSMQGIGYKEIISYIDGEYSLDYAIELVKQGSRRYAKRQITWFKRDERIIKLNPYDDVLNCAKDLILKKYGAK